MDPPITQVGFLRFKPWIQIASLFLKFEIKVVSQDNELKLFCSDIDNKAILSIVLGPQSWVGPKWPITNGTCRIICIKKSSYEYSQSTIIMYGNIVEMIP